MVVMCVLVVMHCIIPLRTGGTGTMRQRNELLGNMCGLDHSVVSCRTKGTFVLDIDEKRVNISIPSNAIVTNQWCSGYL
ncbi:hypothetical protein PR003_g6509 [Phytophthora rubi]|uniref:Secreted protein n=1 Tax=Phytophthora rubi TaxID=129364 RepID=A0A6A3N801_9STRA|nr:hypothetical protein PR002_g6342 [Phytophthora rubi]KAE9042452.1 hypothetical protein PR001_g6174 [Phytophthora rubi]KAE9348239.1 hypothetical protein PR003_g6509 [Phytophthora rubi]